MLLLSEPQMWELISIIIPKIKPQWESLAYCMRYNLQEVRGFKTNKDCCISLFDNWLSTSHGPKPKTYQTLLKHIKKIDELTAASEEIEKELVQGRANSMLSLRGIDFLFLLQVYDRINNDSSSYAFC